MYLFVFFFEFYEGYLHNYLKVQGFSIPGFVAPGGSTHHC